MLDTDARIPFFRPRREGKEAEIEDVIFRQISSVVPSFGQSSWMAGSLPLGAGIPDIVVVNFRPEVFALCRIDVPKSELLAYLRAIRCARVETIADHLRQPCELLVNRLNYLVNCDIVRENDGVYSLSGCWKDILPEITTIEVKVADWKRAVSQAARNRIFAHHSYVALPEDVAFRIRAQPALLQLGIGILGVDGSGHVRILRAARRHSPKVWDYYYKLAEMTAMHLSGDAYAICHKY